MDILQITDQRLQTSNCQHLSMWQMGRQQQQVVNTPGPSITDVPGLNNRMSYISLSLYIYINKNNNVIYNTDIQIHIYIYIYTYIYIYI